MNVQRFEITDSRGVEWQVVVSGPYRSGSLAVGESLESLPQKWKARFSRPGVEGDICVELHSPDVTAEELLTFLEKHEEWIHGDSTKPRAM